MHNMKGSKTPPVVEQLTEAAGEASPAPGRKPWDYGWSFTEYRHSANAAISGPNGPVKLSGKGIAAYEEAVILLLNERRIKERWQEEEFWGVVATLVTAAAASNDPASYIDSGVTRLRTGGQTLVIQLIANVEWGRAPLAIGDAIVGNAGYEFLRLVREKCKGRPFVNDTKAAIWLEEQIDPRKVGDSTPSPVAIACWSAGQAEVARRDAERQLQNFVDLTLLLEKDLKAHKIFRRGSTNRPGVRGLSLDRGALERGLADGFHIELASSPLMIGDFTTGRRSVHWYGVEPLPLGELLDQEELLKAVGSCFRPDPVSGRVRVAARWYAEAHYASADDDAALALGVAMDSLLTGESAMPGSAMADRFAYLSPDPTQRGELVARYLKLYKVRSTVAHGGRSDKLAEKDFLDEYRANVHWAARRLIALRNTFKPSSEQQITSLFNELRWGTKSWPSPAQLKATGSSEPS